MRRKIISYRQDHHSGSKQDKDRWLPTPQIGRPRLSSLNHLSLVSMVDR
jgi:hypothetical protein